MASRKIITIFAVLALAMSFSANASADVEGPHVSFEGHIGGSEGTSAGGAIFLDEQPFENDMLYGGRLGLWMGAHLGLEGTLDTVPTKLKEAPNTFTQIYHFGVNGVLNIAPYKLFNPYVTFGWSNLLFQPDGSASQSFNGWEAGLGLNIRMAAGNGKRVDFRLDARNVFTKFDQASFGDTEATSNTLLVTAGVQFSMGANQKDSDQDGVVDRVDHCPGTELFAVVDINGCPLDGDADGVPDGLDRCPTTSVGAMVDADGCSSDTDADGVFDGLDQCPSTLLGAIVDETGCARDTDADGVVDGIDECPNTPIGTPVDTAGCTVVLDADADGVFDSSDLCPGTPAGVEVDPEGCPVIESEVEFEFLDTGLLRLSNVYFESSKADLKPESFAPLNQVGQILVKWPQLKIEISGHTDSQGSLDFNAQLSEDRAKSVYTYMATHFPTIDTSQYTVVGYGESRSIATNDTSDGRSKNRRVEFRVLNREVLKR